MCGRLVSQRSSWLKDILLIGKKSSGTLAPDLNARLILLCVSLSTSDHSGVEVGRLIRDGPAPRLSPVAEWSADFHHFVRFALVKDPLARPSGTCSLLIFVK